MIFRESVIALVSIRKMLRKTILFFNTIEKYFSATIKSKITELKDCVDENTLRTSAIKYLTS